jgi:hypothetical protein
MKKAALKCCCLPRLIAAIGLSLGLTLGLAMFAGIATAAPGHTPEAEQACTPDVMRLCSEAIPDERRIVACLKKKRRLISVACTTAMTPKSRKKKHRRRAH